MNFADPAVYAMLIRPMLDTASYSQTAILGFFPGHAKTSDVLDRSNGMLDPAYLSVMTEQAARERKFTLLKPTDDVTFMLIRSQMKNETMKAALVFKTTNGNFRLTVTMEDATIHDITENQRYGVGKADIVQFNFKSAIMLSEAGLLRKQML